MENQFSQYQDLEKIMITRDEIQTQVKEGNSVYHHLLNYVLYELFSSICFLYYLLNIKGILIFYT